MSVAQSARESIDLVLSEVSAVRDQARLQTHLLSLDARSQLERLEASLHELEARLLDGGGPLESAMATARELGNVVKNLVTQQVHKTLATPVNQLMSRGVRTCTETTPLAAVTRVMWEADCGLIPVLDSDNALVGVVTDRDICMAPYTRAAATTDIPVSAVMSMALVSVPQDAPAQRAVELMQKHRVRRLPVLASDGKLVGILSLADLVTLKDPNPTWLLDTLAQISRPRPRD